MNEYYKTISDLYNQYTFTEKKEKRVSEAAVPIEQEAFWQVAVHYFDEKTRTEKVSLAVTYSTEDLAVAHVLGELGVPLANLFKVAKKRF